MEKGIFDGLKVLDCASFIAAPAAATVDELNYTHLGAHLTASIGV